MRRYARFLFAAAVLAAAALAALALLPEEPQAGVAAEVDRRIGETMDGIAARAMADPDSAMSSNPYDYAAGEPFERLVALGTPALPVIEDRIDASPESGLREYLLAIAAERIAKVDLKRDAAAWQTGKEWPALWRAHLRKVPREVDAIAASKLPAEDKRERLRALGTPAIPFVMDEVAAGRAELAPALGELVDGTAEVSQPPAKVTPAWARANADRFQEMRSLVTRER